MTEDTFVVKKSLVKEYCDLNVAGDFAEVLNQKVLDLVDEAVERAKANQRKTVRGSDL